MIYFLKFLFISFLVIVILGYLSRFLLGYIIRRIGKKYGGQPSSKAKRREGEVHIENNPKKKKIIDDDLGDFVDYEEVE